jgi:hypothetical protein
MAHGFLTSLRLTCTLANDGIALMKSAAKTLFVISILASAMSPGFAGSFHNPGQYKNVPGPLMGAGLPVLAVGYGAYWLLRRYRKPE